MTTFKFLGRKPPTCICNNRKEAHYRGALKEAAVEIENAYVDEETVKSLGKRLKKVIKMVLVSAGENKGDDE